MNTIYIIYNRIKRTIFRIIYVFIELTKLDGIRINSTAKLSCFEKIYSNNFGDDLNLLFLREIVYKKLIYYPRSIISHVFRLDNYICIGSTIESRSNEKSIIWGAGMISADRDFIFPKKICAVRGKLTRQRFIDKGIDCPQIYGDPALLLPLYYYPKNRTKLFELGIIPHYVDINNKYIQQMRRNDPSIEIIDVTEYSDWHLIIDKILSCKYIVSSSLHGLIVSDAYGIPNLWVEFSKNISGERFKFYDYYSSINKEKLLPIFIDQYFTKEELIVKMTDYTSIEFDPVPLIEACPFMLKSPNNV